MGRESVVRHTPTSEAVNPGPQRRSPHWTGSSHGGTPSAVPARLGLRRLWQRCFRVRVWFEFTRIRLFQTAPVNFFVRHLSWTVTGLIAGDSPLFVSYFLCTSHDTSFFELGFDFVHHLQLGSSACSSSTPCLLLHFTFHQQTLFFAVEVCEDLWRKSLLTVQTCVDLRSHWRHLKFTRFADVQTWWYTSCRLHKVVEVIDITVSPGCRPGDHASLVATNPLNTEWIPLLVTHCQ